MEKLEKLFVELAELYGKGYVSAMELQDVLDKHTDAVLNKDDLCFEKIRLLRQMDLSGWREFRRIASSANKYVNKRKSLNRKFIRNERKKNYEVEGNRLDPKQVEAVVACEDAALFLAPAGSGKSASLLAKIEYLVEVLKITPKRIIVIAFTNKVVTELKMRIKANDVEIRTFHSLGNKIIRERMRGRKLISDEKMQEFFRQEVERKVRDDPEYERKSRKYWNKEPLTEFCELNEVDVAAVGEQFAAAVGIQKGEKVSLTEFKRKIEGIGALEKRSMALEFFELYAPVAKAYQEFLEKERLYDFADMLNLATEVVGEMKVGDLKYQYILVDEAQDLSTTKCALLKAILDKCERVKLFAVGDDWQSIYRFAGSNLRVLDDFEKIFKRETYRGIIALTYRFGQPTAKISNKFIQKNPHQSRKRVVSHVKRRTHIEVALNNGKAGEPEDYSVVDDKIQGLYAEYGERLFSKSVQIISRYNRDIHRVVGESEFRNVRLIRMDGMQAELEWKIVGASRKLNVSFCSIHKAKGITRDIVFVINMNSGDRGMPARREDESAVKVMRAAADEYPFAEERRLFYVAITRAREKTILVAEKGNISEFVLEVKPRLKKMLNKK